MVPDQPRNRRLLLWMAFFKNIAQVYSVPLSATKAPAGGRMLGSRIGDARATEHGMLELLTERKDLKVQSAPRNVGCPPMNQTPSNAPKLLNILILTISAPKYAMLILN